MAQREIENLPESEMLEPVGRTIRWPALFFSDESGPGAIPVNYAVANGPGRLSRQPGVSPARRAELARGVRGGRLASRGGDGWSVLARGGAAEIPTEEVPALVKSMDKIPQPVAEGVHNVWIALTVNQVTGRRLGDPFVSSLY